MAVTRQDATISPRLVTALDWTWGAIMARHPDVPAVVIALGAGSGQRRLKFGHFAPDRWQRGEGRVPELFIGGEGLARGSLPVLGTLLHEGAHGVAATRGIRDTSRQGRFHNTRFRALAEELGITVEKDSSIGWSKTTVPDVTAALYRAELRRLDDALVAWRHADGAGRGGRANSNNGVAAVCGCGRRIRVALSVIEAGPITCGLCGGDFSADLPEDS